MTNIPVVPVCVCSDVVFGFVPSVRFWSKINLLSDPEGKIDFLACSTRTKSWIPVGSSVGTNPTDIPDGINDLDWYNLILLFCANTSTKNDALVSPPIGTVLPRGTYEISSPVLKGTLLENDKIVYLLVKTSYPSKSAFPILGSVNVAVIFSVIMSYEGIELDAT